MRNELSLGLRPLGPQLLPGPQVWKMTHVCSNFNSVLSVAPSEAGTTSPFLGECFPLGDNLEDES